jgi:hypothetical protein
MRLRSDCAIDFVIIEDESLRANNVAGSSLLVQLLLREVRPSHRSYKRPFRGVFEPTRL